MTNYKLTYGVTLTGFSSDEAADACSLNDYPATVQDMSEDVDVDTFRVTHAFQAENDEAAIVIVNDIIERSSILIDIFNLKKGENEVFYTEEDMVE